MQQIAGMALTGDISEQSLFFIWGPGGNGKGTFIHTIESILGDYAEDAAMDSFTAHRSSQHPTDLASLRGARLVTASETESGAAWNEQRIKQLTGGDMISARFMRQDFFKYLPQFTLVIIGNDKPTLRTIDDAIRRRFNIIPFTVKPDTVDLKLGDKLQAEWPGILRWMINGCLDWQENGLIRPQSVLDATGAYFEEQDIFGQWLEDECEAEPTNRHKWETVAVLFKSWVGYSESAGEHPGSRKGFGEMMRRRGLTPDKGTRGVRRYLGIQLKNQESQRNDDNA
jgi:putative DNA primase/helicase